MKQITRMRKAVCVMANELKKAGDNCKIIEMRGRADGRNIRNNRNRSAEYGVQQGKNKADPESDVVCRRFGACRDLQ